jgi:hypothetical protein
MCRTADQVPLNIECVVDRRMNRNEALENISFHRPKSQSPPLNGHFSAVYMAEHD